MIIKDKKLLKETSYNFVEKHIKWLIMFLIALVGVPLLIAQGIGLDKLIDYIHALLIGLFVFIIFLVISVLVIYKKNIDEKIRKKRNFKRNFQLAEEMMDRMYKK